jgi:GTPase SAR1 family protein
MAIIKIISNPYENTVAYQRWDESTEEWVAIDAADNPNSALLSEELSTGFFPFKVDKIVNEIFNSYSSPSEGLELRFEGPDDEYQSLVAFVENGSYCDTLAVSRSSKCLQNARDVLPEVVKVFGKLRPLIIKSTHDEESVNEELRKFTEAANNIIPICVVGNYSSGKSTFINALLGAEYLPAGEEPLTAKVYQISRASQAHGARVDFELDGRDVSLRFDNEDVDTIGLLNSDPLKEKLEGSIRNAKEGIVAHVSKALETLNGSIDNATDGHVSDLISVEVPFSSKGLLGDSQNEFKIFDTPGPNSVSNAKHVDILRGAMKSFSNGIPIFISEYNDLDSTDSEKLYNEINTIDSLDPRFTMIVVSKADHANLPSGGFSEEGIEKILDQAVVRSLYAEGIYFVSSLIGLGSKNGGDFLSDYLVREFSLQESMYSDPASRFYMRLYEYDILPDQIKKDVLSSSERCENKLFANSGLYCVEKAINAFAGKYASYNKCRQLEQSLENAYVAASEDTKAELRNLEGVRKDLKEKLSADMNQLTERLEVVSKQQGHAAQRGYSTTMDEYVNTFRTHLSARALRKNELELRDEKGHQMDLPGEIDDVSEALDALGKGLQRSVYSIVHDHDAASVKNASNDFRRDFGRALDEISDVGEVQGKAKKEAMLSLLDNVNEAASDGLRIASESIDGKSKDYWTEQAETLKAQLVAVVTDASGLSDSARDRLTQVIMTFPCIKLPPREDFQVDQFIIHPFETVHKSKLAKAYNERINTALTSIDKEIERSHAESFCRWSDRLLETLEDNITEFSPTLHDQYARIQEQEKMIEQLRSRQDKLCGLVSEARTMIEWKQLETR